jgi:hypothetical protein
MPKRFPKAGAEGRQRMPDADTLEIRQRDGAMFALSSVFR